MSGRTNKAKLNQLRLAAWLLFLIVVAATAFCRWPTADWLRTGFDTLLPGATSNPWAKLADARVAAQVENQLLLFAEAPEELLDETLNVLDGARETLVNLGYVDESFEQQQATHWRNLAVALFPHRHGLITREDFEKLDTNRAAYLDQFRRLLYSPLGNTFLNTLPSDPAGLFNRYLRSSIPLEIQPESDDGEMVTEIILLRISDNRLGFSDLDGLFSVYVQLKEEARAVGINLAMTGIPLYSAYGAHSGRQELSSIGALSLLLLVLLLYHTLRSPTGLLLTLVCIGTGLATALALTVSILGEIHVLTLVFGATLIGIAVDYAFHYLAHSIVPGWSTQVGLQRVFRGLSLAFLSSGLAFCVLLALPFPGIRQIGLFMASGLLGAWLTVCLLFPALYAGPPHSAKLPAFCHWRIRNQKHTAIVAAGFFILVLPGVFLLQPEDDVRDFYASPRVLEQDAAHIRARLGAQSDMRYFLIRGESSEDLLRREEALFKAAREYQKRGELTGLSGISRLVPSEATQSANFAQVSDLLVSREYLDHIERLGLGSGSVQSPGDTTIQFYPATTNLLKRLDLPIGAGGFLGCDGTSCASWVQAFGVASPEIMDDLANRARGVELVDRIGDINSMMARYRTALVYVLIIGATFASLLLSAVTGWRRGLAIMALPMAACLFSIATSGYVSGGFSIVNVLALFLIAGVGIDFAVFRILTPARDQAATTLAISLSAATSFLAFGMLAFSRTPLISSFGLSIAAGLFCAWALSWFRLTGEEV